MGEEENREVETAASLIDERLVMSRSLALMWCFGGVLMMLTLLLPPSEGANEAVLFGAAVVAYMVAGIMFAVPRLSIPMFEVITVFGTIVISATIIAGGTAGAAYAFYYVWLTAHSFYFLGWKRAMPQLLLNTLACPAALALSPSLEVDRGIVAAMVIGSLLVVALFVGLLKDRVGRLLSRLSDAAQRDVLTGLLNRRGFEEALMAELDRAQRGDRPFSLLIADLDHFKEVNDRFGHQAGDDVLFRIGESFESVLRKIDTAARIGGDEFALLLPETEEREAYAVAERIRTEIGAGGQEPRLTISIGIAAYPQHGGESEPLTAAADGALYVAKEFGRNRSMIHSPDVTRILARRGSADAEATIHVATMTSLAEALDIRDMGTAQHSQAVGRYSEMIALELDLPADRVERIKLAGTLHDIGKIGVPDAILLKPGPLDPGEWEQMKRHPEIGSRLLGGDHFGDVRGWVLAHHERPDGRGYPNGLVGEEIPLEARILAVADAYEAMTNDRVYRPAIGQEAARSELRHAAGEQFDERVVEAFLAVIADVGREVGRFAPSAG